ncbi:MAG: putative metal-binding motif-containing protein [Alphaproteobacteria bacterium]|nr:putative metal-binding motif-containing protein [Alphaproteobacteria bacterium]
MQRHTPALLLLVACTDGEYDPKYQNSDPVAAILSPEDGALFSSAEAVEFLGSVVDINGPEDIESVTWTSSLDGTLASGELTLPDSNSQSYASVLLSPGRHGITLRVVDTYGASDSASIFVSVTDEALEPVVELLSPDNLSTWLSTDTLPLEGTVRDGQQSSDTLSARWVYVDPDTDEEVLISEGIPSSTGAFDGEWALPPDGSWILRLIASDDEGYEGSDEVLVVVGDAEALDIDGDGVTPAEGDCDDSDPDTYPGAPEVCGDGADNDCDGELDDKDLDLDGFIDSDCEAYTGSLPVGDCDDADPSVNPDALDSPDLDYIDENCDGVDGDVLDAIFLDPVSGSDGWDGLSTSTAVRTLDEAYRKAAAQGRAWVLIADGEPTLTTSFQEGVSLAGGYDAGAGWSRSSRILPLFDVGSSGVVLSGWRADTEWQQLAIDADAATSTGGSSIALTLYDCTGFVLQGVEINAGTGRDGAAGATGADGNDGSDGGDGVDGCEDSSGLCDSCGRPAAGVSGAAGSGCSGNAGGAGGRPGKGTSTGSTGSTGGGSWAARAARAVPGDSAGSRGTAGGDGSDGSNGRAGDAVGLSP